MRRIRDYILQSHRDLEAARNMLSSGMYEWTCFLSHQCCEKAIKAVLEYNGIIERGHSLKRLLHVYSSTTGNNVPHALSDNIGKLDVYFISSRHVTAFDIGTPMEHHSRLMAEEAISIAEDLLEWTEKEIGWEI